MVRDSIDAVRKGLLELKKKSILEWLNLNAEKLLLGEKLKCGFAQIVGAVWTRLPSGAVTDEIMEGNVNGFMHF